MWDGLQGRPLTSQPWQGQGQDRGQEGQGKGGQGSCAECCPLACLSPAAQAAAWKVARAAQAAMPYMRRSAFRLSPALRLARTPLAPLLQEQQGKEVGRQGKVPWSLGRKARDRCRRTRRAARWLAVM